jgi:hypothetical protein
VHEAVAGYWINELEECIDVKLRCDSIQGQLSNMVLVKMNMVNKELSVA